MAMIESYRIGVELVLGGDLAAGIEALIPSLARLDESLVHANADAKTLAAGLEAVAAASPGLDRTADAMGRLNAAMASMNRTIEHSRASGGESGFAVPGERALGSAGASVDRRMRPGDGVAKDAGAVSPAVPPEGGLSAAGGAGRRATGLPSMLSWLPPPRHRPAPRAQPSLQESCRRWLSGSRRWRMAPQVWQLSWLRSRASHRSPGQAGMAAGWMEGSPAVMGLAHLRQDRSSHVATRPTRCLPLRRYFPWWRVASRPPVRLGRGRKPICRARPRRSRNARWRLSATSSCPDRAAGGVRGSRDSTRGVRWNRLSAKERGERAWPVCPRPANRRAGGYGRRVQEQQRRFECRWQLPV